MFQALLERFKNRKLIYEAINGVAMVYKASTPIDRTV